MLMKADADLKKPANFKNVREILANQLINECTG